GCQSSLESGRVRYGQVVAVNAGPGPLYVVLFHRVLPLDAKPDMTAIVTDEIALVAPTLDALISHGKWPVVGNRTPDLNRVPFPAYRLWVRSADNWHVEAFDFGRGRPPVLGDKEYATHPSSSTTHRPANAIGATERPKPWTHT